MASLTLLGTVTLPGIAEEASLLLEPPGLRFSKDPSTVIPAHYEYPNKTPDLPFYRDPSGRLKEGWVMKVIKTRRFFSNRSARVYFRTSDLARSTVFNPSGPLEEMRIWPSGTLMILETYEGNDAMMGNAKPVETAVMSKMESHGSQSPPFFFLMDWSYAKYTPGGDPSLMPDEVQECHRCHSIAFYLTGDLIFTPFP